MGVSLDLVEGVPSIPDNPHIIVRLRTENTTRPRRDAWLGGPAEKFTRSVTPWSASGFE